jgi:hypothetical protein
LYIILIMTQIPFKILTGNILRLKNNYWIFNINFINLLQPTDSLTHQQV